MVQCDVVSFKFCRYMLICCNCNMACTIDTFPDFIATKGNLFML